MGKHGFHYHLQLVVPNSDFSALLQTPLQLSTRHLHSDMARIHLTAHAHNRAHHLCQPSLPFYSLSLTATPTCYSAAGDSLHRLLSLFHSPRCIQTPHPPCSDSQEISPSVCLSPAPRLSKQFLTGSVRVSGLV